MDNLITYYYKKIEELQKTIYVLEQENLQLESYLFELLTGDCSEEYKNEIRTKLFTQDERIG
jgi:hypothetical protein